MPSTCRLSRKPSATRGMAATKVSGSKNARCTDAHPGVLMTVSQAMKAKASVEATATSTERTDRERRYARRPSSSSLGRRDVESITDTTLADAAAHPRRSLQLQHAGVLAEPRVGELLQLAGGAQDRKSTRLNSSHV